MLSFNLLHDHTPYDTRTIRIRPSDDYSMATLNYDTEMKIGCVNTTALIFCMAAKRKGWDGGGSEMAYSKCE